MTVDDGKKVMLRPAGPLALNVSVLGVPPRVDMLKGYLIAVHEVTSGTAGVDVSTSVPVPGTRPVVVLVVLVVVVVGVIVIEDVVVVVVDGAAVVVVKDVVVLVVSAGGVKEVVVVEDDDGVSTGAVVEEKAKYPAPATTSITTTTTTANVVEMPAWSALIWVCLCRPVP